jgi:signal transduction histidine kinase
MHHRRHRSKSRRHRDPEDDEPRRRRSRRHRRGERDGDEAAPGYGLKGEWRSRLTPEQKMYRAARSRANQKMAWTTHFVAYCSVLVFLLVTSRSLRATIIVAFAWGIGLTLHYFVAIVAPGLRQRWIDDEVDRHVSKGASRLDRTETKNARSIEGLSASIAHEIRNPVTAAKSLVQQMGEDPGSSENLEYAQVALEELDRVERSISHLLKYARDEEFHFQPVSVPELVDSAIGALRERTRASGVSIHTDVSDHCSLRGDVEKLRRVVVNLLSNAIDALADEAVSDPCIEVMAGENLAGSQVWMRIRDNGPGIRDEEADQIFDPFYTTKQQGTGLGLALSKKVVEGHGGSLEVASSPSGGAEFLLTFPKNTTSTEGRA